jgi:glutamyl-Q tRNA(Asp) synthetase
LPALPTARDATTLLARALAHFTPARLPHCSERTAA